MEKPECSRKATIARNKLVWTRVVSESDNSCDNLSENPDQSIKKV